MRKKFFAAFTTGVLITLTACFTAPVNVHAQQREPQPVSTNDALFARSSKELSAEDKTEIAEVSTRFNWAIETWNLDALISLFTDDGAIDHPVGYGKGKSALPTFFDGYKPETIGVRHHTLNYVITSNDDGTANMVRSLLVLRAVEPKDSRELTNRVVQKPDFPNVRASAVITDHLRKVNGTWRLAYRHVGQVVARDESPQQSQRVLATARRAFDAFAVGEETNEVQPINMVTDDFTFEMPVPPPYKGVQRGKTRLAEYFEWRWNVLKVKGKSTLQRATVNGDCHFRVEFRRD